VAIDGTGGVWSFWGQINAKNVVTLRARRFGDGNAGPEIELASSPDAGNSFVDAATDGSGRLWVTWQEIRPAASRIWVRHLDRGAKDWSAPVCVSTASEGGNWEPRLACSDREGAWVAYDSSAAGNFDLRLARVTPDGKVRDRALTTGPEYEARCSIASDGDGGLWIAAERGRRQWGLDSRGHENEMGMNAAKRLLLGRYEIAKDEFTEVPVPERGRPTPSPDPTPGLAVNLPCVAAPYGEVWVAYRYFSNLFWRTALIRYLPESKAWSQPVALPDSTMGQDRHNELTLAPDGQLWICWPSDHRQTKVPGTSAVYAAAIDTTVPLVAEPEEEIEREVTRLPEPAPYLAAAVTPRAGGDHHTWTIGGKTYRLCWGDLHRHTDISNCRTGFDGCIVEAYRYAYDMAKLDFLGTSDHTDVGKAYDPYEWWHTQRQVDVFYAPGQFTSMYAYEREQPFPWGHRNIVFAERGGPLIYIKRQLYRLSPWQARWPVEPGVGEILPAEVWDLLHRYGKPCAIISHTGATGMGTDWTRYEAFDQTNENLVEIFQGARVSYEGLGAPQPTVGLRAGEPYTPSNRSNDPRFAPPGAIDDFQAVENAPPTANNGVYQKALSTGKRLGVFASSDHISTHTSFGGVYVEEFSREGIIAGFNARRTCAATDKIFVEFSCGDHLRGEEIRLSGKPELTMHIEGTAPLQRITIVRNEEDYHVETPGGESREFSLVWTDPAPLAGENRYYLRVEQAGGNMAWSSPLWTHAEPGS
jgi:hypothetical protein